MHLGTNEPVVSLKLDLLIPNSYQPRKTFNDNTLNELALSIREYGVINPILVRQQGEKYEIIAGERRVRAAKKAGLTEIPAIIKNIEEQKMAEIALIENLQRENITPIEEAESYEAILKQANITESKLSEMIGKSQSSIANKIRLLSLPDIIKNALLKREISERHARALLAISDEQTQTALLQKIINEKLTVKELEKIIKEENKKEEKESENMNNENFFPNVTDNTMNQNTNMVLNQPNMVAPTAPQVDIMPMNNQAVDQTMTTPLMPMPNAMPMVTNPNEMVQQTPVMDNQVVSPIPNFGMNNMPEFNQVTNFNTAEPVAPSVPDMPVSNETEQISTMEPLNNFPLFDNPSVVSSPVETPVTPVPVIEGTIPNTMEQVPVTPAIPPMVDTPLFTTPEQSAATPVTPDVNNALNETAYEIPVTKTPVAEVDKFMQVKELLNNNEVDYKAYSNETGHCIIIEL